MVDRVRRLLPYTRANIPPVENSADHQRLHDGYDVGAQVAICFCVLWRNNYHFADSSACAFRLKRAKY